MSALPALDHGTMNGSDQRATADRTLTHRLDITERGLAMQATRTESAEDYIRARIKITDSGCWEWTRARSPLGYGQSNVARGSSLAHRLAYLTFVGPIPDGLQLDHLCVNPPCCNPAHLEAVTSAENNRRSSGISAINARKTHCADGHELAGDNLVPRSDGARVCRTCKTAAKRRSRARRTALRLARANEPGIAKWLGEAWLCPDCGRVLRRAPWNEDGTRLHSSHCPTPMVRVSITETDHG